MVQRNMLPMRPTTRRALERPLRTHAAALLLALTAALAAPAPVAAAGGCFTARGGARAKSSSQRVTLTTQLKLSDRCDYGLSPQGPWRARPLPEGDFTSIALALAQTRPPSTPDDAAKSAAKAATKDAPAAKPVAPGVGESAHAAKSALDARPSSLFARARAGKRRRVGAADSGMQSIFLAGCTDYLMGPGSGFALSVPVDTQRPTVTRTPTAAGNDCGGDALTLGFVRDDDTRAGLRAGPWEATLPAGQGQLALEPGRWAIYAGVGDAGMLVGRLQSGRSESGLRSALSRAADVSADPARWFRPSWASGHMQLEAASGAVTDGELWAELRTAAAAGALWFAQSPGEGEGPATILEPVRIGAGGARIALPEAPLRERMRARYGSQGASLVPTWDDWDGVHDAVRLCVAQRYTSANAKVVAGSTLPTGAVCAALGKLTAPLQARGGEPIAPARICIKRHRHTLTIDGDSVGEPIGEHCIDLPTEPSGAPSAFPIAAVGDQLLYSGGDSAGVQLCIDNTCAPMPTAGQWQVLVKPGLMEVRHAPVASRVGSARGLSLLRIGVIDPAREWHPVGLLRPEADEEGAAKGDGSALPWGQLDHDAPDTFAYVRREQRMDFRMSLSPALVTAFNGAERGSKLSRHLPIGARVDGGFGAPDESTFVALVTRGDSCPESPAGALQPDDLVDPDRALVGERFHVHLAQFERADAPYRCIATASMRVTPRWSRRAGDDLRLGLLGDVQAVMFVMPRAALGVAVPVAYARQRLFHGFGIDASASLTVAASIDGPEISRAGLGLSGALYWGPEAQAPALLSIGVMLHAAAATHSDPPIASLYTALNVSTLLDLAGGR